MEKRSLRAFLVILGFTGVFVLISFLPFVVQLAKAKKDTDLTRIRIHRDAELYKLVRGLRLRAPYFWSGSWKYKYWWTTLLDILAFTFTALFAGVAILLSESLPAPQRKSLLILAALLVLYQLALVIVNIVAYNKLFKATDGLFQRFQLLDAAVREASLPVSERAIWGHLRTSFADATPENPISTQALRMILLEAINKTKSKSSKRIDGDTLAQVFSTCCIIWHLHQLPPDYRYDAIREYIQRRSIQRYLTPQTRPIVSLDKTSYLSESVYGRNFLRDSLWSQFNNRVEVSLQRINTAIPQSFKYDEVAKKYRSYLKTQVILRSVLFALLIGTVAASPVTGAPGR